MNEKIKIGISACLIGKNVRYDGAHKFEPLIIDTLEKTFENIEFVPVCPEVEAGFPIPREPVRLEGSPASPRMISVNTGIDITDRVRTLTVTRLDQLSKENLRGFIFKSRSPSCALEIAAVHTGSSSIIPEGTGIFARAFIEHFPHIPVIDEVKFRDEAPREKFLKALHPGDTNL